MVITHNTSFHFNAEDITMVVKKTDLAPMDWKLQDSDDTTHPSVSSSPSPEQKVKQWR